MARLRRNTTAYGFRRQQRATRTREPKPVFLIVCEGSKTEPQYFRDFTIATLNVKVVGTGHNTVSLIEKAEHERTDLGLDLGRDQVWCVFDKDDCADVAYREAIQRAHKLGFRAAYSNEAFELWFLLHYDYHDAALSRSQYGSKLTERLGRQYRKNDARMYETLLPMQETAIANAARLLERYAPNDPAKDNPCTTVHELVTELNRLIR